MVKNYIREIRKNSGMTLQQLADALGTTNQQISNLETGKRRLTHEWITRLSQALGCHPLDITEGPGKIDAAKDDAERELLDVFRGLDDGAKMMYLHTLKSFGDAQKAPPEEKTSITHTETKPKNRKQ